MAIAYTLPTLSILIPCFPGCSINITTATLTPGIDNNIWNANITGNAKSNVDEINNVNIDWGDNTTSNEIGNKFSFTHSYYSLGFYILKLKAYSIKTHIEKEIQLNDILRSQRQFKDSDSRIKVSLLMQS